MLLSLHTWCQHQVVQHFDGIAIEDGDAGADEGCERSYW